jgi:parallel beta-helix repeat protein
VIGNSCSNNRYGINISQSSNNTICDNDVYKTFFSGIYVSSGSNQNTIWNNTFVGNNRTGIVFNPNYVQGCDNGNYNRWNSTGRGNFWSDWTVPDHVMPWGIIDNPYNLSGSAGAKDCFPIAYIPEEIPPATSAILSGTLGLKGWYISDVNVTLNATDGGSGVNHTECVIDFNYSSRTYFQKNNGSIHFNSEGVHDMTFWSYDNNGNRETNNTIHVRIDKTAPTTRVSRIDNEISFIVSDNYSGRNRTLYRVDNGSWVDDSVEREYGSLNLWSYGEGNHTIEYYSDDDAGNIENIKTIYLETEVYQSPLVLLIGLAAIEIIILLAITLIMMRKLKNGGEDGPPTSD